MKGASPFDFYFTFAVNVTIVSKQKNLSSKSLLPEHKEIFGLSFHSPLETQSQLRSMKKRLLNVSVLVIPGCTITIF